MGKMKNNFQMLENCFANSENIRDAAKMEAISSKLIRQNSRLQKEKEQLARQARKQELCIGHLLKKLEDASGLAKDQQANFDQALHRRTETVASMLQELSKSRNEIIQLRNELELERSKNVSLSATTMKQVHKIDRIPSECEDFSDEATVLRNNIVVPQKGVAALEDEIAHLRHSLIQQEAQYKESLKENSTAGPPAFTTSRPRRHTSDEAEVRRMYHDRFRPDDDIEIIHQPFAHHEKRIPRSGLQEVDTEAPRPPLSRQASGVRGSSPVSKLPAASSNSRSFAMDAVRLSSSSRSLGEAF